MMTQTNSCNSHSSLAETTPD